MNAKDVATQGTILLTRVGSTVHGTGVNDQDDEDQMGICIEPAEYIIGLKNFEQYEWRTQPAGVRSGPGDIDLTIYSLRKWMRLATAGNPSILVPLFVPKDQIIDASPLGHALRDSANIIVSRKAGPRFLGYARAQREKLLGLRGNMTNRPELIERYGFDTKFAYHMLRLGYQGVELLETGRFTLPMAEPMRSYLVDIRTGRYSRDEAIETARYYEDRLKVLIEGTESPLPLTPHHQHIDDLLYDMYTTVWRV